ncbi:hypothetical protein [Mesorhizobium sp. M0768]|uniref:hypothetical protein n=1 Tax=Mesorhizobium sp. M0768 TaxID=2956996 RepID=UPI0033383B2E
MSDEQQQLDEWQLAAMASVQEYARRVNPIVSCVLHPSRTTSIDRFLKMMNEPPTSEAFVKWGLKNGKRKQILSDGINSNTRNSLSIAAYHYKRIHDLDHSIVIALHGLNLRANETVAGGDITILNAEYQAFILSCRRCLDQLTYALSSLYKNECTSFRKFGKSISNRSDEIGLSEDLLATYYRHRPNFDGWLMKDGDDSRSIRDDLAHYKSISVGTLNVNLNGISFVGTDAPRGKPINRHLPDLIRELFLHLSECVEGMVGVTTDHFSSYLIKNYST